MYREKRTDCGLRHRNTRRPEGSNGFTLVEVALAMAILVTALMAMSASTLQLHDLRRQNRERSVAMNAMRGISEEIHSVAALAKESPGTWSQAVIDNLSPGGIPGDVFRIRELGLQQGFENVGDILVITDETLTDAELGFELGMPRDLDGDGAISNTNVTANARILPIVIRTRWRGVTGDVQINHPFYVMGY